MTGRRFHRSMIGVLTALLESVWASTLIADIMGVGNEEHEWLNTI